MGSLAIYETATLGPRQLISRPAGSHALNVEGINPCCCAGCSLNLTSATLPVVSDIFHLFRIFTSHAVL